MARYLPVYLPRAYSTPSDPCVYVHALAVSLCNRTTGTRIPTSSLYFPAHKFISWKIGWPSCVGSAPRRRSPPISLAKTSKSSGNRSAFFTFVHFESSKVNGIHAHILRHISRHSTNIGSERRIIGRREIGLEWSSPRRFGNRLNGIIKRRS